MNIIPNDLSSETCHESGCERSLEVVPGRGIALCPQGHCWGIFADPAGLITGSQGLKLMRRRQLDRAPASSH